MRQRALVKRIQDASGDTELNNVLAVCNAGEKFIHL